MVRHLMERLQDRTVSTRQPVAHIVSEALANYFGVAYNKRTSFWRPACAGIPRRISRGRNERRSERVSEGAALALLPRLPAQQVRRHHYRNPGDRRGIGRRRHRALLWFEDHAALSFGTAAGAYSGL